MSFLTAAVEAPSIAYETLIPYFILTGGAVLTLFVSLISGRFAQKGLTPLVAVATLIASGVFFALQLSKPADVVLSGALKVDGLAATMSLLFITAALVAIVLAWRGDTVERAGRGEIYSLLITVVLGMTILAATQNLVTLFLGLELFSIPLYVLCAADLRRSGSLESGLKYLIIGSLGSATMLYGMAFLFGGSGSTDFAGIAKAAAGPEGKDSLLLIGIALTFVGIAFKASIAPFHQWTPDVYEGAPTPITAFMAVATKAAAFALLLRFCGQAIAPLADNWAPVLAVLATVTIVIGNLGALGQDSVKRMLAYSGVAQAGYLLVGVVAADAYGAGATAFYLFVYLLMNVGPFAVVIQRERSGAGAGLDGLRNLGREAPLLAWPMTICMIALAGLPITAGFMGKLYLIQSAVSTDYAWLAVVVVLGSAMSLAYYLRVVAAMWMSGDAAPQRVSTGAVPAGASPEADAKRHPELVSIALIATTATLLFGFWPGPLVDLANYVAVAFSAL